MSSNRDGGLTAVAQLPNATTDEALRRLGFVRSSAEGPYRIPASPRLQHDQAQTPTRDPHPGDVTADRSSGEGHARAADNGTGPARRAPATQPTAATPVRTAQHRSATLTAGGLSTRLADRLARLLDRFRAHPVTLGTGPADRPGPMHELPAPARLLAPANPSGNPAASATPAYAHRLRARAARAAAQIPGSQISHAPTGNANPAIVAPHRRTL